MIFTHFSFFTTTETGAIEEKDYPYPISRPEFSWLSYSVCV